MASGPACFEAADMAAEHSSRGFTQKMGEWINCNCVLWKTGHPLNFLRRDDSGSPLVSLCLHLVCTFLRIHDQFRARVPTEKHQLMLRVICNSSRLHAWAPHCTTAHLHSPPICAHVGFNLLGRVNPSMECVLFSYLAAFLSLVDQLFHIPDLNIRGFPKRVARSGRHPTSGRLSAVPSQHHHPRNGGFLKWIKMEVFPNYPS